MGVNMFTKHVIFCISFSLFFSLANAQTDEKINAIDSVKKELHISLIMPFCSADILENTKHKNAAISEACRNYYEGFLLALDSFKTTETPISIEVLDTKRDSLTFSKLSAKKEVVNSDLIIGPVLKEGNEMMLDYCKKYKKYHVSPFLTLTKSAINNPYLISVYPDLSYYADFILETIKQNNKEGAHVFVAYGKETNDKVINARISSIKTRYPQLIIKQLDISKINDFSKAFDPQKKNYFILASENEYAVGSALRNLSDTLHFTNFEVYGFRKWLEFKSPNIHLLERLNVKLISPFYFDYSEERNKIFVSNYREKYHTEPGEYAIAGFEQGLFFIRSLILQQGNMKDIINQNSKQHLSNRYQIRQKDNSKSLQNDQLNILFFQDGKLNRLN
jgi:hypothetical protein